MHHKSRLVGAEWAVGEQNASHCGGLVQRADLAARRRAHLTIKGDRRVGASAQAVDVVANGTAYATVHTKLTASPVIASPSTGDCVRGVSG